MEDKHRAALNDNLDELSTLTNFDNVLGYLTHHNVFTERELLHYASDTFKRKAEEEKCRALFTDIQRRGPKAFPILLECLKKTNNHAMHKLLAVTKVEKSPLVPSYTVKKAVSFAPEPEAYKMSSYPRGCFILINNIIFSKEEERNGAECDEVLEEVLKAIGYVGNSYKNVSAQDMEAKLINFANQDQLLTVDSLIVGLMSHGGVDECEPCERKGHPYITGSDSQKLFWYDILKIFNDSCKLPEGRPKIFFLQACRGKGVLSPGFVQEAPSSTVDIQIPCRDTIVLAACAEGFQANRDRNNGTWFIQVLSKVLAENAHNLSLYEMKKLINKEMEKFYKEAPTPPATHQTTEYVTLGVTKELYFNPGLYLPDTN